MALFAGFVRRAVFRARSATILAGFFTGISNFLGATFRRVEEGKFDFDGNIRARSVLGFFSAATRKLTEYIAENIGKTSRETAARETARKSAAASAESAKAARCAGVFEFKVVLFTLFGIGKRFVRLVYLFEFFGAFFVVRVQVGVILPREFSVRAFYFVGRGGLGHAQNFVIVFCHIVYLSLSGERPLRSR